MTTPQDALYAGIPQTKTCSKCKISKPTTDFGAQSSRNDGLKSQCKDCVRIYQTKYRLEKNKLKVKNPEPTILSFKVCSTCKLEKPIEEFRKVRSNGFDILPALKDGVFRAIG